MERRTFVQAGLALGAMTGGMGPIAATRPSARFLDGGPIRLSSNENALGLSPAARRAVIDGIAEANRYPSTKRGEVIRELAAKHDVAPESIVLGNGSTEVLQMMVQATASRRTTLVIADPTFEHVPRYSVPESLHIEAVPLSHDLAHDLGRMTELTRRSWDPVLVYICNPNNPTGTLTSSRDVDAWIESAPDNVRFMVDEAYFEYADDPRYWSAIKWIEQRPNLVVVRTFSKIYGMAGMRLGYGIAHPSTARHLTQFMSGSNANELALRAGLASLRDPDLVSRSLQANSEAKKILCDCLDELDLEYIPTHANFVMHRIKGEHEVYRRRMREHNIEVGRPFPPMLTYNRLSLGLPAEMEQFAETLRMFRTQGWV